MSRYRLELTPDDNDTFLVTCPKLPEVASWGVTEQAAAEHGAHAVAEAVAARLASGATVPAPD